MGGQGSKDEHTAEQLKLAVDRIKSCMEVHHSNVCSIESAINAQTGSVEILLRRIPADFREQQETESEHPKNDFFQTSQNLLANIQNTLVHQAGSLRESFDILNNCIGEISAQYSSVSGSSVDTARRRVVPVQSTTSKDMPDTLTYESERHTGSADYCISKVDLKDVQPNKSVQALRTENDKIISRNNELQNKLENAEDAIKSLQQKNERLQNTVKQNAEEIKLLAMQKEDLLKQKMRLESEKKTLNDENQRHKRDASDRYSLQRELQKTRDEKCSLQYTLQDLQYTLQDLRKKVNDMEDEKRKMKERKMIAPVQLFYQRRDELMTLVVNELSAMLETQMQAKRIQLEIVRCENISSIQPDKPILVLCINSSRLGTDASTAIEGVQKSGRTALLIFHHKNIHALPNQPSDRMLTSSEFKQLGGIFDLAFLSGKGIYPCDMNNLAMGCIESFIQKDIPGK